MVITRQTGNIQKDFFEYEAWQKNTLIVGIDEVGRGCFAGPVLAAAVILPINTIHPKLRDSKIMTAGEREEAFQWIRRHCIYGIGMAHHRIINEKNIWNTTLIAMKKALMHVLQGVSYHPSAIVTDAMPLSLFDTHFSKVPVHYFCKGESRSSSIAAASIVAKVTRDALMKRYDCAIPGYGLSDNKGYGTSKHRETIKKLGSSFIHREQFVKSFLQNATRIMMKNITDSSLSAPIDRNDTIQLTLDTLRAHSEPVK